MSAESHRRYRSLFWPLLLIGIGVIWLLGNIGVLSASNLAALFRLWPLLLIAIGLDLLFGRSSPLLGALIGLGTVAVLAILMIVGPSFGLGGGGAVKHDTFIEPIGDTRSAEVALNLSVGEADIHALQDSPNLIDADIYYMGEIQFQAEGGTQKTIQLGQNEATNVSVWPFASLFPSSDEMRLRWDVGLSSAIPLALAIQGGVGQATLDLADLTVTALTVDNGVGATYLTIPVNDSRYTATLTGGVGEFMITVPEGTAVDLVITGGVGEITVDVPDQAAVRVEREGGLGDVTMPSGYTRVSGNDDTGVWESQGAGASPAITIAFKGGLGALTIR